MAEHWYQMLEGWKEPCAAARFDALAARVSRASVHAVAGHAKSVNSLDWSASGSRLASGSDDRTARVWAVDAPGGHARCAAKLDGHADSVTQLRWDPATEHALMTLAADRTVRLWDARRDGAKPVASIGTHFEYINAAWSPDGRTLAVGSSVGAKDDGVKDSVSLVDLRTQTVRARWTFGFEVNELCWSPDSRYLLVTTESGRLSEVESMLSSAGFRVPTNSFISNSPRRCCFSATG